MHHVQCNGCPLDGLGRNSLEEILGKNTALFTVHTYRKRKVNCLNLQSVEYIWKILAR